MERKFQHQISITVDKNVFDAIEAARGTFSRSSYINYLLFDRLGVTAELKGIRNFEHK
jgi:hypothetical protein